MSQNVYVPRGTSREIHVKGLTPSTDLCFTSSVLLQQLLLLLLNNTRVLFASHSSTAWITNIEYLQHHVSVVDMHFHLQSCFNMFFIGLGAALLKLVAMK